jgi:hypothetical protein
MGVEDFNIEHCLNHTNVSVQFQSWNYWRLCWEIDVGPPLFTLLQPEEMMVDGATVLVVADVINPQCSLTFWLPCLASSLSTCFFKEEAYNPSQNDALWGSHVTSPQFLASCFPPILCLCKAFIFRCSFSQQILCSGKRSWDSVVRALACFFIPWGLCYIHHLVHSLNWWWLNVVEERRSCSLRTYVDQAISVTLSETIV